MLRKLDVALNCGLESEEGIKSGTAENLQKLADAAQARQQSPTGKKTYKIDVPAVDEEFPELKNTKTEIFPLPISHENQCKTVGLASNLDRFTEEFKFKFEKNEKYMPLKDSGKEFALDKAYERFAFMKSLERHREKQATYEHILRRTTDELTVTEKDAFDEIAVVVEECASTSSSSDDD